MTGGAGFIGSHVVDRLIGQGHEVAVVDDLSTGGRDERQRGGAGCTWPTCGRPSCCASSTPPGPTPSCTWRRRPRCRARSPIPAFDASVNILGMLNLLEACRAAGVRNVVYISTGGAAYGDTDVVPTPETHLTRPASPYGVSKVAAELYLDCWAGLHGARGVSLRLANVYGPRQNPEGEAGVVAIFTRRLLSGALVRDQRRRRADARLRLRGRRGRRGGARADARRRPPAPSTSAPAGRRR